MSKVQALTPTDIAPPLAPYSAGILVPLGQQLVFCSGQVGLAPDGTVPAGCEGQARQCFANIAAILRAAKFGLKHVIRINAFVTGREHLAAYMAVRNDLFTEPYPASTLLIVNGFSRPEFVVEIEVVAAKTAMADAKD